MSRKNAVPRARKKATKPRFWLSVLEDSRKAEWPPTIDKQRWKVLLTKSETVLGCNHPGIYRTSPIFPATAEFVEPQISKGTFFIGFYSFDPAFRVLGRVVKKASRDLKAGLMYSLGLASILVITDKFALLEEIEKIANEAPRSKRSLETYRRHLTVRRMRCY